jgi:hemolysin III
MMKSKTKIMPPKQTLGEEIANSVTHGIGALLSIAGTVILIVRAVMMGTPIHVVSFAIYGLSLILLHTSSSLYHGLHAPRAKRVFWVLDHSTIYLLIAGTYTPFLLISLWGAWGLSLLIAIWTLAILGILLATLFIGRFRKTALALYLTMGWLIVLASRELWLNVPHEAIALIAAGGLSYTLGVAFYVWKRLPYSHMIWHLFVLGGSITHYFAILLYLLPKA